VRVEVIRDVLDKQLLDEHRTRMGKVDGLVLELRRDGPPRVTAVRVGTRVWAHRLGRPIEALVGFVSRRFWGEDRGVWEIPWTRVQHLGKNVQVTGSAQDARVLDWERWLRDRIVGKIPGANR
jgi:hypothetical protein